MEWGEVGTEVVVVVVVVVVAVKLSGPRRAVVVGVARFRARFGTAVASADLERERLDPAEVAGGAGLEADCMATPTSRSRVSIGLVPLADGGAAPRVSETAWEDREEVEEGVTRGVLAAVPGLRTGSGREPHTGAV